MLDLPAAAFAALAGTAYIMFEYFRGAVVVATLGHALLSSCIDARFDIGMLRTLRRGSKEPAKRMLYPVRAS